MTATLRHRGTAAGRRAAAWAVLALGCAGCGGGSAPGDTAGSAPKKVIFVEVDGAVDDTGEPSTEAETGDAAGDAAADASDSDGGAPADGAAVDGAPNAGDAAVDVVPPATSCAASKAWASGRVLLSDPAFERFGGVSSDELTVVWTAAGDVLEVADRSNPVSDFGSPATVPLPQVQQGTRPALDPSGDRVVLVASGGTGFAVLERPSAAGSWTSGDSTPFAAIAAATAAAGDTLDEPVFGASGDALFYLMVDPTGAATLYESAWDATSGAWSAGQAVPGDELASTAVNWRRPTGASSDDRTLFFFDEEAGIERAAWRADRASPFTSFADVAAAPEAAPNAACSLLYVRVAPSAPDGPGVGVAD